MQNTVILRGRDLFGTTVIDNRFISELVPDAPENAVRVYLYGLMLAGGAVSSPVSISDALKLSDAQVAEAFRYWEKEKSYGEAPRGTRLASQFKYTLF